VKEITAEQLSMLKFIDHNHGVTTEDFSYASAAGRLKTLKHKGMIEGFLGADLSGGRNFKRWTITETGDLIINPEDPDDYEF